MLKVDIIALCLILEKGFLFFIIELNIECGYDFVVYGFNYIEVSSIFILILLNLRFWLLFQSYLCFMFLSDSIFKICKILKYVFNAVFNFIAKVIHINFLIICIFVLISDTFSFFSFRVVILNHISGA